MRLIMHFRGKNKADVFDNAESGIISRGLIEFYRPP